MTVDDGRPDPKVLQRVADGVFSESLLASLVELQDAVVKSTLRRAFGEIDTGSLTEAKALAYLYELRAYDRIEAKLRGKVRVGKHAERVNTQGDEGPAN